VNAYRTARKLGARPLVLNPGTVEMHVGNILAALDSRSRAEVVRRATEPGLLEDYSSACWKCGRA
jgi:DNA-binding CsgD family transcriptional regulator